MIVVGDGVVEGEKQKRDRTHSRKNHCYKIIWSFFIYSWIVSEWKSDEHNGDWIDYWRKI